MTDRHRHPQVVWIGAARNRRSPLNYLSAAARRWGGSEAISFEGHSTTYSGLLKRIEAIGGLLFEHGVRIGSRVATILTNLPEMLELQFAVPAVGGVLVPIDIRLTELDLAYILRSSGARIVITDTSNRSAVEKALERLDVPPPCLVAGPEYAQTIDRARPRAMRMPRGADTLSISYTGGTTGPPKGVIYSHHGCAIQAVRAVADAGLTRGSRHLWTLPMSQAHGWGYVWAVTAVGATHFCLPDLDPAAAWMSLAGDGITHLCCTPTILEGLVGAPRAERLRRPVKALIGDGALTPALGAEARALGLVATESYGLTESYGSVATAGWQTDLRASPPKARPRLHPHRSVSRSSSRSLRVVDEELRDVTSDGSTVGEIVVERQRAMDGYYRDGNATSNAFDTEWLRSGDLAVMHPDGSIEIRDRINDMVVTDGEEISTIEVEQTLLSHSSVAAAGVVGIPHRRCGEVLKAFVVLRRDGEASAPQLQRYVGWRIGRSKVPRLIEFCPELPTTATGKVKKNLLR